LLNLLASPTPAATSQGDLYLFSLQPLDAASAEACIQLVRKHGTQPIPVATWPKPLTPTARLLQIGRGIQNWSIRGLNYS